MDALTIKQTFTVGSRTFDSEAEAQAYALAEQRKRQAVEILATVRPRDPRRMGHEMDNGAVVALVADHLEAFAQILAVLNGRGALIADEVIRAHAQRLGLTAEQLTVALLQHGSQELDIWTECRESDDPGSVWHTGDVPDWLEPHLPQREGF